jgi:hypothetical protein
MYSPFPSFLSNKECFVHAFAVEPQYCGFQQIDATNSGEVHAGASNLISIDRPFVNRAALTDSYARGFLGAANMGWADREAKLSTTPDPLNPAVCSCQTSFWVAKHQVCLSTVMQRDLILTEVRPRATPLLHRAWIAFHGPCRRCVCSASCLRFLPPRPPGCSSSPDDVSGLYGHTHKVQSRLSGYM